MKGIPMKTVGLLTLAFCIVLTSELGAQESTSPPYSSKTQINGDDISKGLVLHYTFNRDETGAGKITDISGAGNHGTPSGIRWTTAGKNGGAYEFRTDGDRIEIPNNTSINPQHITLAAWVKTSVRDTIWRRIFDKSYSQGYSLGMAADYQGNRWSGLVCLELGPGAHFSLTRTVVADGKWHHIAATFDGTEQILYVDGKPEGIPARWSAPGQIGTTNFNLAIGCNRSNVNEYDMGTSFRGLIDEPMVWNRALSVKEVAFLFTSQNRKGSSNEKP